MGLGNAGSIYMMCIVYPRLSVVFLGKAKLWSFVIIELWFQYIADRENPTSNRKDVEYGIAASQEFRVEYRVLGTSSTLVYDILFNVMQGSAPKV